MTAICFLNRDGINPGYASMRSPAGVAPQPVVTHTIRGFISVYLFQRAHAFFNRQAVAGNPWLYPRNHSHGNSMRFSPSKDDG